MRVNVRHKIEPLATTLWRKLVSGKGKMTSQRGRGVKGSVCVFMC